MGENIIIYPIVLPLIGAILLFLFPKKNSGIVTLLITAINFCLVASLFNKEINLLIPWGSFGIDFSLRLYQFSGFIILCAAFFSFLISLYILGINKKEIERQFCLYLLITLAFVSGAVLADNFVLLLFFWEGLLITLFGFIMIGGKESYKTAIKAFIIIGISDLCFMGGIALTAKLAGTLAISQINLPLNQLGAVAFILLVIGAISKAGSMPFHTWIPDAAEDAPVTFMAFIPGAIEKLLGIYLLTRLTLDVFILQADSAFSLIIMIIGGATIILAVMMALIQKNYKKLLSYHAISQVGYMILGIGTCVPAGIVGGIFHMVNNAIYKSCLFLTAGAVEQQAGTADLEKLGGLRKQMPLTFICFLVAAVSISGVPPFNGFFSKELIYDGALERGKIFYFVAIAGSFFTALSFLKLGHGAYFGGRKEEGTTTVKEAPIQMLIPMIVLASVCILFGIYNSFPLNNFIQPILGERIEGHSLSGFPHNNILIIATLVVLFTAIVHHFVSAKIMGGGLKAVDHIHYAPFLSGIYDLAQKHSFDPYDRLVNFIKGLSKVLWKIDRGVDWIYNFLIVQFALLFSHRVRRAHSGYYVVYVSWSLIGALAILLFIFYSS